MKRPITTLLAALLLALCLPTETKAADGTSLWTNVFNSAWNGEEYALCLAVDGSGNVYVTGQSTDSSDVSDYATIKYSSAGVPLWTNRFNGTANRYDKPTALAVDGSGNAYVTGYSYTGYYYRDYATIKYSSAGVPLWTNRFNGTGNASDTATALAVDGGGNVYVTGYSTGSGANEDYATIKYSSAGVPLWTSRFNGAGNDDDEATALAVDSNGDVYVTGWSAPVNGSLLYDYATIKYSSAGVLLWTKRFNGAGNLDDEATALAVDGSGNVYVTGYSTGSGGNYDYATIKYSTVGVPLWTNLFNGVGNGDDEPTALAVDSDGNVYVTGYTTATNAYTDYATIKYSSAGVPVWTNRFNGAGDDNDWAYSLAVDGRGNVYVTGSSKGSAGYYDYVTIKYSSAGVPVWTNRFNGTGNNDDEANAVAVDGDGNVYVTGYTDSSGGGGIDYATIKYSGPPVIRFVTTGGNFGFTNKQFRLTLTGPAGSNAVISASTNLHSWKPLATNSLGSGTLTVTDTLATNFTRRFYRANLQ
jgi:uncharacterized delta-60 repeat protein